ncbi:beta-1,6-N-acetylglucosaminyltransferase [Advenella sp. FME57]|uniref:beta-1,6-N-acetylglucosaminyltransferase n=1 Tax=Advenella sp. FME57 TaxID=2742604 RepID=UPI00186668C9
MVKIIYILMCHGPLESIFSLVDTILEADDSAEIIIHYDNQSDPADYNLLLSKFNDFPRCHTLKSEERVNGYWGTFGLVQAVLNALRFLTSRSFNFTHCYLLSGSCFPIRPLSELKHFLYSNANKEFIECQDTTWIFDGIREDRYRYRHFFSKRRNPKLFRLCYLIQKKLLLRRNILDGFEIKFGSQWWCLSRATILRLIDFIEERQGVVKFFRTVWIPDECFFQTLVYHLCHHNNIANRSLTYYEFDSTGKPKCFTNCDITDEMKTTHFFVRKYR